LKYLDDGRFMVPVASSAVTQEEWNRIFGPGAPTCEGCNAPMEELPPGTVWPTDEQWYCSKCKRYKGVRAPGFCKTCGTHQLFCKCTEVDKANKTRARPEPPAPARRPSIYASGWAPPPERTRIDSKPRKIFTGKETVSVKISARQASKAVNRAVKEGFLKRPRRCSLCGNNKSQIHGHHVFGYRIPFCLCVQWLCFECHDMAHRILGKRWDDEPALHNAGVRYLDSHKCLRKQTSEIIFMLDLDL